MNELKEIMEQIQFSENVEDKMLHAMRQAKGGNYKSSNNFRARKVKYVAAASIACVLALGSVSSYAAYRLLSADDVVEEVVDKESDILDIFKMDDAILINESQINGGYRITLIGIANGKQLTKFWDQNGEKINFKNQSTYIVTAVEKTDGSKPKADETWEIDLPIAVFHGKSLEYGIADCGATILDKDNVRYELVEIDNLEPFANVGVSLCFIYDYNAFDEAFTFDEATGLYSSNPDYKEAHAIFELPLDKSKADDKAVEEYFRKIDENKKIEDENNSEDDNNPEDIRKEILSDERFILDEKTGIIVHNPKAPGYGYLYNDDIYNFFINIWQGEFTEDRINYFISCGTKFDEMVVKLEDGEYEYEFNNKYGPVGGGGTIELFEIMHCTFTDGDDEHLVFMNQRLENDEVIISLYEYDKNAVYSMYEGLKESK